MKINFEQKTSVDVKKNFKEEEFDNILKCVHCGLCLDYCPTYRELGDEKDSPRGRLYLMRGLWEGELKLEPSVIEPLSRCLDCRACESACPSGVPFGELLEKTRGIIFENTTQSLKEKVFRKIFLKNVFCSTNLLIFLSRLIKIYAASGIPKLFTKTFLGNLVTKSFVFKQFLIPNCSGESFKLKFADEIIPPFVKAEKVVTKLNIKNKPIKVGMFSGCIMDVSEATIHYSTLSLLRYLGCEVIIPSEQNCCGALHVHSGDRKTSRKLALQNLAAFKSHNLDAIITNAAGCGAQLKEYHLLFPHYNLQYQNDFSTFENKIVDIMEFIYIYSDLLKNFKWRKDEETIIYDSPCHLVHAQKIDNNPRKLLNSLPGVNLVALRESDWCCGSAGIYNLTQPKLSAAVLNRKTESILKLLSEHPNVNNIVTGNPGCIYQIRAGIRREKIDIPVIHPIVFLANRLKKNES